MRKKEVALYRRSRLMYFLPVANLFEFFFAKHMVKMPRQSAVNDMRPHEVTKINDQI